MAENLDDGVVLILRGHRDLDVVMRDAARDPTFTRAELLRRDGGGDSDFQVILRYASKRAPPEPSGAEVWRIAESRVPGPPPRWKMAILTMIGIYPLLVVLIPAFQKLFGQRPIWLAIVPVIPVAVAAMTWVVMPGLTRAFGRWLSSA